MLCRKIAVAVVCTLVVISGASVVEAAPVYPYFEGSVVGTNRRLLYGGEIFMPAWQCPTALLFFDGRVLFDTKHRVEGNVGLGYRQLLLANSMIVGANVFGDVHRSRRGFTYHQLSFGAELMTCYFEARANVYLPNDKKNTFKRVTFPEEILGIFPLMNFVEKEKLPEAKQRTRERALHGYDIEIGLRTPMPFYFTNVDLWLYGGWYQYRADSVKNIEGGRARLEMQIRDPLRCIGYFGSRITLEAGIRSDTVRDGEGFFGLRFAMPLYDCISPCVPCGLQGRMSHRIVRHEQVVVNRYQEELSRTPVRERVKNPNGDDIRIIYVDGFQGPGGIGTIESPFFELSDGLAALTTDFDILYLTGRAESQGSSPGLDTGEYVVPGDIPNLQIIGAGVPLIFEGCTLFEKGTEPQVTGVEAAEFVLDISDVENLFMSGFRINTPANATEKRVGLKGNFTDEATSIILDEMNLTGNATNPEEVVVEFVYNNNQENHLVFDNTSVRDGGNDLVQLTNHLGTLKVSMTESFILNNPGFGLAIHNEDQLNFHSVRTTLSFSGTNSSASSMLVENLPGANAELTIKEGEFSSSGRGLSLVNHTTAKMDATLVETQFSFMDSYGLSVTATGADSILNVLSDATDAVTSQVGVVVNALSGGTVNFDAVDSGFISNSDEDVLVQANTSGKAALVLKGGNTINQLKLIADSDGTVDATRTENDSVQEVEIEELGTGSVTVDPDPFPSS